MEKFPSLQNFYTHAVTDVTDNYQVWRLKLWFRIVRFYEKALLPVKTHWICMIPSWHIPSLVAQTIFHNCNHSYDWNRISCLKSLSKGKTVNSILIIWGIELLRSKSNAKFFTTLCMSDKTKVMSLENDDDKEDNREEKRESWNSELVGGLCPWDLDSQMSHSISIRLQMIISMMTSISIRLWGCPRVWVTSV